MSFGIYFHWPFCDRICPYCDFNVYRPRNVDQDAWLEAYKDDLRQYAKIMQGRTLSSIYFGGGTPSLMPANSIHELIALCDDLWGLSADAEITLEANPTDAERDNFSAFSKSGVNRLSLGIQSFDDSALKFLGRNHSAKDAAKALDTAQEIFDRVTIDLIYALPDQSLTTWEEELKSALERDVSHISLYQLTVEPETAFQKAVDRKEWSLPQDDHQAAFFDLSNDVCSNFGLHRYEVSNHAKPGCESQHNFLYWRYRDYIGIGPGGHGRLTLGGIKSEITSELKLNEFLKNSFEERYNFSPLSPEDQYAEKLLMGLRLSEGTSLKDCPISDDKVSSLVERSYAIKEKDRLFLTKAGLAVLNAIVLELLS